LSEVYDSKIAGTGKTLTPTAVISDGNGGNNYLVTYVNNTTGVIDPGQIVSGMLDVAGNETATGKTVSSLMTALGKITSDEKGEDDERKKKTREGGEQTTDDKKTDASTKNYCN